MIDPKQPPPGWVPSDKGDGWSYCPDMHAKTTDAHRIYAAESQPAVVDFAERITSWLESFHGHQADVIHEIAGIILAAARGERALP